MEQGGGEQSQYQTQEKSQPIKKTGEKMEVGQNFLDQTHTQKEKVYFDLVVSEQIGHKRE